MAGIKDYRIVQANNTSLNGIDVAEGMLPSNLNNALRALMKNTRDLANDSQWFEYGVGSGAYTSAWVSTTQFTIASGVDISAIYHVGRRLKVLKADNSLVYGSITATSNNGTLQTVTATFDSGNLGASSNVLRIYIGALSKTNSSIPTEIIGTSNIANNAITAVKILDSNITVAKMADNSVDSDQYVNGSIDTIHIADAQVTTAKITDANVTTAKITDANVTTAKIADSNVTTAKIADSNVTTAKLATNAVTTIKITDGNVTTAKIADSQITSAKIADGAIVNADVNASAAIAATKIHDGTISNTEFGFLNGASSNIQTQIDAKGASNANLVAIGNLAKTDGNLIVGNGSTWVAENGATARTSLGLGSVATQAANNVSISGGSVTGLGNPSNNSDAATKSYVDQAVAGLRTRTIAECASTANVNISNGLEAGDAIDGITLVAGDRVLLKNQSTASQNGLYLAVASGAGAASRDPEHDTIAELSGGMVITNQGSVNDNKIFLCTTDSNGSLGSIAITYTVVTPSNSGTVTSIATGTGINGGTITAAGTISIDNTVTTLVGTQTLTNKTLTAPAINTATITSPRVVTSILDSGGNELAKLTATGSAVNEFTIANAASGNAPRLSSTGETNVGLDLLAKGTGHVTIRGNSNSGAVQFNCESNTHGQIVKAQPHSASVTNTMLLPAGADSTLVSLVSADTLTNKTLTSPKINENVAVTSTATEINKLDAVSRGSIIYGNASAATAILTKGGAGTVLTSDGTDIAWSDPASGGTDWQSSIVTGSTITVVAGRGYWINTTSNTCTITLPSSASVGDELIFVDYARTWGSNKIIIDSNGLKYQGDTDALTVEYDTNGQSLRIVYSGATKGWIPTEDDAVEDAPIVPPYSIEFLVIAGGGGGGFQDGGGGGAGGYRTSTQTASAGNSISITVGDGAAAISSGSSRSNPGSNSSISGSGLSTITSTGGGGGGYYQNNGKSGGSGGGAYYTTSFGQGNTPSTSPSQGNNGGTSETSPNRAGGGGGASAAGDNGSNVSTGGAGTASSITGSSVTRAGGGGGGRSTLPVSSGGAGGGGTGARSGNPVAGNATANTGGGGGGGFSSGQSGAGGKGVVILSMPDASYSGTTSGSPTVATGVSGKTVLTFNGSGSYTS